VVKVKVVHFVFLRAITNVRNEELEVETATVGCVIKELAKKYGRRFKDLILNPATGQLQYGIIVALNNRDVRSLEGLDTKVNEGDVISLLPPIPGG